MNETTVVDTEEYEDLLAASDQLIRSNDALDLISTRSLFALRNGDTLGTAEVNNILIEIYRLAERKFIQGKN